MFTRDFLHHDLQELALEIRRRCLVLGLDDADEVQLRLFAHDLLQNMDRVREQAAHNDAKAKVRMELYSLSMLMHKSVLEVYGPAYMQHFDEMLQAGVTWAAVVTALWREMENRNMKNQ